MTKVLIVGATGYIGRGLFKAAKDKFNVVCTSSKPHESFIELNLKEPEKFPYEIISSETVVVITAANSSPDACANDYQSAYLLNVLGTSTFIKNVLEWGGRVIFLSSDAVYGECDEQCDESSPVSPLGEYARMKYEVEKRFETNSLFKSIRLSYVFSRNDKFTKYLLNCAGEKIRPEIFHPFYRAIVYREDVIDGVIALIEKWHDYPQKVLNFGGPEVVSKIMVAETLNQYAKTELKFYTTEPPREFFLSRPRSIAMQSPFFHALLGRLPRNLNEAMRIELALYEIESSGKL